LPLFLKEVINSFKTKIRLAFALIIANLIAVGYASFVDCDKFT